MSCSLATLFVLLVVFLLSLQPSDGQQGTPTTCEMIDGDCPDDCAAAGFAGDLAFTALFHISPWYPEVEKVASRAEKKIAAAGEVAKFDNPVTGLHMSLLYFCCYTGAEKKAIQNALHDMTWSPFTVVS